MKIRSIIRYPLIEIVNIVNEFLIRWPSGKAGSFFRNLLYSKYLKSNGKNVVFHSGVRIGSPKEVQIGDNCIFGRNVNIDAGDCYGVFIGNNVCIADGTYLRSANHNFDNLDIPIRDQGHSAKLLNYKDSDYSVIIEDDVWVGARAIILSGTRIGSGSVISAGAVVSNIIPPNSIVVGNPGRVIANREKKKIHEHEEI